jgi:outer membrane protein, heavy metal efflux system
MLRYLSFILLIIAFQQVKAQPVLTAEQAVELSMRNQRNLKAANLAVVQQQDLLKGSAGLENPQLQYQVSPYDEGGQVGVQQTVSFPSVYRNRKALQHERIRLAQLQLQGSQYELKREVRLSFLSLQYLAERARMLAYQDSIYQIIKVSAKRFFEAGQINKLEELQAVTQADQVNNELNRIHAEILAETQILSFYTGTADSFIVDPIHTYVFNLVGDSMVSNIRQQILQQQIVINQRELGVARTGSLPELQAGVLFPTISKSERPVGYQFGLTIPIWRKQNRSRISAAKTGIEIAKAEQELEQQRLNVQYRQSIMNFQKELQSLAYFNNTALPQARDIMETSQRLFQGGELNYIESLRNLQAAFEIFFSHIDTKKRYNETVIHLNYLNGTL